MTIVSKIARLAATFFYAGLSPKMPGTMGSLAALPCAYLLWQLPLAAAWTVIALVFLLGTWSAERVIAESGIPDHQIIVIDEVIGIFLTTSVALLWWHYLLAFFLFRAFDIAKPWPVSWVDARWKNGFGTMLDDVVAALMATVVLATLRFL